MIDGFNISKLSLEEVRTKITIIMQDPQLFEGTLRQNIDPLSLFSDEEIISTLKKCRLSDLLEKRKGLATEIESGGDNLS